MGLSTLPAGVPGTSAPNDLDAWLKDATADVDQKDVKLTYTLPVQVEPWVGAFSKVVSRGLFRYARRYRDE
jgi:hypothetical protein